MALYDSTNIRDVRYLLSQTPPDYTDNNYYLNELQMKVDADWPYRPNRKTIEEEKEAGTEKYSPLEVVVQSVKNDKGETVSDDWYRLVFKDCRRHNVVGNRYRFSYDFDKNEPDDMKNVWIGMNQTSLSPTSSQVICRCNGTICSIYLDENGSTHYHYEPVIQATKLNSAGFDYSEIAIDPDGSLVVIAQYNKYTKQYYINERFVIGNSYVYKITNIAKYDTRRTYQKDDVGIIKIYMSMDQVGNLDDIERGVAYNGVENPPSPEAEKGGYNMVIESPSSIPEIIPEDGIEIFPVIKDSSGSIVPAEISYRAELIGDGSSKASLADYCDVRKNSDGSFTIIRKRISMSWKILLTFSSVIGSGEQLSVELQFTLRPF